MEKWLGSRFFLVLGQCTKHRTQKYLNPKGFFMNKTVNLQMAFSYKTTDKIRSNITDLHKSSLKTPPIALAV